MLISLMEYAIKNKKDPTTLRKKAENGGFKTAVKIGRNWAIDSEEKWEDKRIKSGKYIKK